MTVEELQGCFNIQPKYFSYMKLRNLIGKPWDLKCGTRTKIDAGKDVASINFPVL
jgi:hypothetical protein